MLDRNWLQLFITDKWSFWLFGCRIQRETGFQKPQNVWVVKVSVWSFIPCKILRFYTRFAQKAFSIWNKFLGGMNDGGPVNFQIWSFFVGELEIEKLILVREIQTKISRYGNRFLGAVNFASPVNFQNWNLFVYLAEKLKRLCWKGKYCKQVFIDVESKHCKYRPA